MKAYGILPRSFSVPHFTLIDDVIDVRPVRIDYYCQHRRLPTTFDISGPSNSLHY